MTDQTDSGLLWTEEVAELAGVLPGSITFYASQTRRRIAAGLPVDGYLPLPVDKQRREVQVKGGVRIINSPRWDRAAIMAWLPVRKGPGGRQRTEVS